MRTRRCVRGAVDLAVALVVCGAAGCGGGGAAPSNPPDGSGRPASSLTGSQPGDTGGYGPGESDDGRSGGGRSGGGRSGDERGGDDRGEGDPERGGGGEAGDDIPDVPAPPVAPSGEGDISGIGVHPDGDIGGVDSSSPEVSPSDPPPQPCGDSGTGSASCPPSPTSQASEIAPLTVGDGS